MKLAICSILLFTQAFVYTSCGICSKKIDCSGFDDKVLVAWFPCSDGERLTFRNNLNEQESFTLKNTFTTQPYQRNGGFSNTNRCSAEKDFESVEKDSSGRIRFSLRLQVSSGTRSGLLNINQTPIYFNNLTDSGFLQVMIDTRITRQEKLANFGTGSSSFTNVTVVTADTSFTKMQGIYKLYFSKGLGLIAYSEYPSLKTWIKQ